MPVSCFTLNAVLIKDNTITLSDPQLRPSRTLIKCSFPCKTFPFPQVPPISKKRQQTHKGTVNAIQGHCPSCCHGRKGGERQRGGSQGSAALAVCPPAVGWGSTSLPPHHRDKDLTPENSSWGQVLTGAPCCDPGSPRSRSSPWVQQLCPWMTKQPHLQLHPCCQGGRRQQLPFHTREKAALSSSPSHNPIKALLPGGSFSPGVLLGASSAGTHTAPVPATSLWRTQTQFFISRHKAAVPCSSSTNR